MLEFIGNKILLDGCEIAEWESVRKEKKEMKDITAKEFWRVLEEEEILNKKIFGYLGILNILSIYYEQRRKERERVGFKETAKINEEKSIKLYRYLKEKGYYNR